jgi:putative acyltransferase
MSTSTPPFIDKNSTTLSTTRIEALDYLKCLFVLLMVAFHLAYFADGYPLLKQWVYTFHMPGFLLISGYLMRVEKTLHQFSRTLLWLAVPYLLLESSYITLSAFMPVRDGIEHLTLSTFADKFFLHPLGPYWYLHTLILCGIGYFIVWKGRNYSTISRLILLGFYFAGLSFVQLVAWDVSLYFFLGVVIRQSKLSFLQVFRPSWLAFIALLWLGCYPETFHKGSLGGLITVYLVISAALAVFPHLLPSIKRAALFLGRNSLALFLFSPIFTMVCKIFIPYLAFDSSRLLFLALSLPLCVLGALSVCRVLDALHLSPWMLGRNCRYL